MKRLSLLFALFVSLSAVAHPQSFFMLAGTTTGGGGGGGSTGVDTLASGTVSSAANMTINMTAYFNQYRIIEVFFYDIVPATSAQPLNLLLSADGSTYDNASGNYDYSWGTNTAFSPGANTSSTVISLVVGGGLPNGAGQTTDGWLMIEHAGSSTKNPAIQGMMNVPGSSTAEITFSGHRLNNQVTEGMRFVMGSGNISGSYVVVGIR